MIIMDYLQLLIDELKRLSDFYADEMKTEDNTIMNVYYNGKFDAFSHALSIAVMTQNKVNEMEQNMLNEMESKMRENNE